MMDVKIKKLHYIFIIYWVLLTYIIAALVWWFIELDHQNNQMTRQKLEQLDTRVVGYSQNETKIIEISKRKHAQYVGEGAVFLLLIITGAVFLFRAVRKQLKLSRSQQNFMIAITHELKTPIAVTKLNLETLLKRTLDAAQQNRLIQNTLQEANRLNSLCNNMLLSSQIEAGGYKIVSEKIELGELVENCIHNFVDRFMGSRSFNAFIDNEIVVKGDVFLLQMAINNLIDNAIKYSPKEKPIAIVLNEQNNRILLQIKDEGKGIAAEEKPKIFDKFYRLTNNSNQAVKGTGLGLYLAKNIFNQHHAKITVNDNLPTGAVFTVEFDKFEE